MGLLIGRTNIMELQLVMYKESDLETCTEIYEDAFSPVLNSELLSREKVWRYVRDITLTPNFIGYTCWLENEMVAFCFGKLDNYFDVATYEIEEIAVASKYHRQGIGSQVLQAIEKKLAGFNVLAINLNTSREIPAYNFYLKNGYEEVPDVATLAKWL